jgi:hypothetical protein
MTCRLLIIMYLNTIFSHCDTWQYINMRSHNSRRWKKYGTVKSRYMPSNNKSLGYNLSYVACLCWNSEDVAEIWESHSGAYDITSCSVKVNRVPTKIYIKSRRNTGSYIHCCDTPALISRTFPNFVGPFHGMKTCFICLIMFPQILQ